MQLSTSFHFKSCTIPLRHFTEERQPMQNQNFLDCFFLPINEAIWKPLQNQPKVGRTPLLSPTSNSREISRGWQNNRMFFVVFRRSCDAASCPPCQTCNL